jgi:hypothetical protein
MSLWSLGNGLDIHTRDGRCEAGEAKNSSGELHGDGVRCGGTSKSFVEMFVDESVLDVKLELMTSSNVEGHHSYTACSYNENILHP